MPTTRQNKSTTPANSDAYNLVPDLNTLADSLNVVIPVASQTERDSLTKASGLLVARLDLAGSIEWCDGTNWRPVAQQVPFGHLGMTTTSPDFTVQPGITLTMAAAQKLTGGMAYSSNGLVVPYAGQYDVQIQGYFSGATTGLNYFITAKVNGAATGLVASQWKGDGYDVTNYAASRLTLNAGDRVTLSGYVNYTAAGCRTMGTTGYDGTFLEIKYAGA